jgi:hypothetical protein
MATKKMEKEYVVKAKIGELLLIFGVFVKENQHERRRTIQP